jgi:septal ring factor EnvC (AmiA/AmiB activator)
VPKFKIKDTEHNLSQSAITAILAERTDHSRELSTVKDGVKKKDKKISTLNDSLALSDKRVEKLERKLLMQDVAASIAEVDAKYRIKDKNPYAVMASFADVEKSKRKDKAYVQACFDSHVKAKVESFNKKILKDKKPNKNKEVSIPKKYLGGK